MKRFAWIVVLVAAAPALGSAAPRHRPRVAALPPAPMRAPFEFYPQNIEGGVSGNLPFNNQIRKLKDPLNANGAGG